jgi:1-acyl-sn-glycerol-3-phosphate acyltransferase
MVQKICRLLLKWMGWKIVSGVAPDKKAIVIGVPHTSAWDFVISWMYYTSVGGKASTVIKKEFFFWPMTIILRWMNAIPVDRSKGASLVKQVIDEFNSREMLHLAITPEGTSERPQSAGRQVFMPLPKPQELRYILRSLTGEINALDGTIPSKLLMMHRPISNA